MLLLLYVIWQAKNTVNNNFINVREVEPIPVFFYLYFGIPYCVHCIVGTLYEGNISGSESLFMLVVLCTVYRY